MAVSYADLFAENTTKEVTITESRQNKYRFRLINTARFFLIVEQIMLIK